MISMQAGHTNTTAAHQDISSNGPVENTHGAKSALGSGD